MIKKRSQNHPKTTSAIETRHVPNFWSWRIRHFGKYPKVLTELSDFQIIVSFSGQLGLDL